MKTYETTRDIESTLVALDGKTIDLPLSAALREFCFICAETIGSHPHCARAKNEVLHATQKNHNALDAAYYAFGRAYEVSSKNLALGADMERLKTEINRLLANIK